MKRLVRVLAVLACLVLAACDGTALVTLTATPATVTGFLTYRVTLVSVALQDSSGSSSQTVLPAGLSVDLAQYSNITEIISSSSVHKGTYTSATVTVDYTDAVIVADDGTASGVALTPLDASGQSVGQVALTLQFDPASPLIITKGNTSQLSLAFALSASNDVNVTAGTVTITPVLVASSLPIDTKTARVRGPLSSATVANSTTTTSTTTGSYSTGIKPFDGLASGSGSMSVSPTATTVYEINGTASIGTAGLTALSALGGGAWTVAYGTLASTTSTSTIPAATTTTGTSTGFGLGVAATGTTSSTTATTFTTSTNVSFTPTQILAGSSVQGGGVDRISGVVTAVNGNTLTVPSATWITNAGGESFLSGITTITLANGTAITVPGQDGVQSNSLLQISVGSVIDAFGTATAGSAGTAALNAASGRVRLENTVASGLVTVQGTDSLTVGLSTLGGRAVFQPDGSAGPFDFAGTGGSGPPSNPAQYQVLASGLGISNSVVLAPVELTGLVANYGSVPPDFTATALLDPTTINAELVLDWGSAGSTAPFAAPVTTTELHVLSTNTNLGLRHQIAVGAQIYNLPTLGSDLLIEPSTATTVIYAIAHASTSTVENFNTFAAFTTQLQSELNGTTVVTAITADGIYTATGTTLAATSVTIYLNI